MNMMGQWISLGLVNQGGSIQSLGCYFTRNRQYDFITKSYSFLSGGLADVEEVLNMYFTRNTSPLNGEYTNNIWLYGVNVIYTSDSLGSNSNTGKT